MKKRIIISIIGVLFIVIVWILKTVLLPSIFLGSNIKVVDANIATMKSVPFLDIKLRNIGKDVSVIKKVISVNYNTHPTTIKIPEKQ